MNPCPGPSNRREFLRAGALGFGGLCLSDVLAGRAAAGTDNHDTSVILMYLHGGPSHLETYDLKPDAPSDYRSIYSPITTTVPGMDICELFPLQAKLADKIRKGEFVTAPGVYEMLSAKIADQMPFNSLYMTGYGVAASHLGVPDAGIATFTEMADRAAMIAAGTKTPLIADADTGYLAVTIVNRGVTTETLRAIYSNEAKNIRIEDNGKRTFISIPGNSTLRTDSDGISVKFHGLRRPHIEETWMSLVLLFERAGEVAVDAVVQIYSARK